MNPEIGCKLQANSSYVVSTARWTADHSLSGEGTYERCRTAAHQVDNRALRE